MPTCVIIDRKMAAIQQLQLVRPGLTERRSGNIEETLNILGVMGNYVQVEGGKYDAYVSAYVKVEMVQKFLNEHGLYQASNVIWIDGRIGEDETITDEDRFPDEYV